MKKHEALTQATTSEDNMGMTTETEIETDVHEYETRTTTSKQENAQRLGDS